MNFEKVMINKIILGIGLSAATSSAIVLVCLWSATQSVTLLFYGLILTLLLFLWAVIFIMLVRKKLVHFASAISSILDNIPLQNSSEGELIFAKIHHQLIRLYDVMLESRNRIADERIKLQELISDISHQVKTPIANLKIANDLLLEQDMPKGKRRELLNATSGQLDKLDFLMQAMIKTSRLEAGVVTMMKAHVPLYGTLATALGGILIGSEKKHIAVTVDCPEDLTIPHDTKWTSEALFNILDNAVKYSPEGGRLHVSVDKWEFYTKIDVFDNGKGISENHQAKIFRRFYREEEVHDIEGIGIGLFLAREIITMQGGYIKVSSEVGKGSTFSIFLPNLTRARTSYLKAAAPKANHAKACFNELFTKPQKICNNAAFVGIDRHFVDLRLGLCKFSGCKRNGTGDVRG